MTTKTATWGAESAPTIIGTLSGLLATLQRSWSRRRTNLVLADLDDQTLYDIGIEPGQVRRSHPGLADWVIQTQTGTSRIVFIGR